MEEERKIVWNSAPFEAICEALKRISGESIQGAETVEVCIDKKLQQARINPFRFPPDKFKIGNTATSDVLFHIAIGSRTRLAKTKYEFLE